MGSDDNNRDDANTAGTAKWGRKHQSPEGGIGGVSPILIVAAAVVAFLAIFFAKNGDATSIDFVVFDKVTTLRWLILMAILLGALLDRVISIWWRRRRRAKADKDS